LGAPLSYLNRYWLMRCLNSSNVRKVHPCPQYAVQQQLIRIHAGTPASPQLDEMYASRTGISIAAHALLFEHFF
jgi:hypothetical protein